MVLAMSTAMSLPKTLSLDSCARDRNLLGIKSPEIASVGCGRPRTSVRCSMDRRLHQSVRMAVLLPLAACTVLAASPDGAEAGIFSGASGLESIQLPSVPEPGIFKQIQENKKKMYEGFDAKFKSSTYLQELLQKSKDNAAMHKKEIADKYCERGAEWGVGDCSLVGMSQEEKAAFLALLRKKVRLCIQVDLRKLLRLRKHLSIQEEHVSSVTMLEQFQGAGPDVISPQLDVPDKPEYLD